MKTLVIGKQNRGLVTYRNGLIMYTHLIGRHDDEPGTVSVRVEDGWYEEHLLDGTRIRADMSKDDPMDIVDFEPCDWSDDLQERITRRGP